MSEADLVQLNWELCISYLDDCINSLREVCEKLEKATENIQEVKIKCL